MKSLRVLLTVLLIFGIAVQCASCFLMPKANLPTADVNNNGSSDEHEMPPCIHVWSDATCKDKVKCILCGQLGTEYGSHKYATTLVPSTCTEQGYSLHTCEYCNSSYKNGEIPLAGHIESEWIFDLESGEGIKYKECTVCGKFLEFESVDTHVHEYATASAKAPTCTEYGHGEYEYCILCGYAEYSAIEPLNHDWSAWESNGKSAHTSVCKNDPNHVKTEYCSGVKDGELVCSVCGSGYDVSVRKGDGLYGYYALASYENGEKMQALYRQFAKSCEAFSVSEEDVSPNSEGYYVIDQYSIRTLSLNEAEARSVWAVFCSDHPSYYWLSNVSLASVNDIFLLTDEEYSKAKDRRACDSAIASATNECISAISGKTGELEVTMAIAAYIMENMEYAYYQNGLPNNSVWAHNIVGFAMKSSGVCESYAETFMYLCRMNDIECIMGIGTADGTGHAWNYVSIDGEWYGVDLTWSDGVEDQIVYNVFGISDEEFHEDHILNTDTFGVTFSYEIPAISDTSFELCELYRNGEREGIFKSIEAALEYMTDPIADYELVIGGFYSLHEGVPVHTLDVTSLPNVKSLKITGMNYPADPGYQDRNTALYLSLESYSFTGNIILENVDVYGSSVILLENVELTLSGESVYIDATVIGSSKDTLVTVLTNDTAYFVGKTEIYKLISGKHAVVFCDKTVIHYLSGNMIYTSGPNADVQVKKYL